MAQGNTQTLRTTNTYAMAVTALMTAVTCIFCPKRKAPSRMPSFIRPDTSNDIPRMFAIHCAKLDI